MSDLFKDVVPESENKKKSKKKKTGGVIKLESLLGEKEIEAILKLNEQDQGIKLKKLADFHELTYLGKCIKSDKPIFKEKK